MHHAACRFVLVALALTALAALAAGPAAAGVPPVEPGDLLGSTGAVGGSLIEIDPATGAGTFRCPLGSLGPVTEIEFRDDGALFGTTGQGSSNLISIDPDACTETLVGMHPFGSINGLEYVGATLYGSFFAPGAPGPEGVPPTELVIVDDSDATLTTIGTIDGYTPVRGLAWDGSTMYGVGSPAPVPGAGEGGGPPPGNDELFTVDLVTGDPTPIGPTGFAIIGGIEFGPDGVLYGGVAATGPPGGGGQGGGEGQGGGGELVTIDTATGAATPVGPTGSPALSGLAFVPGQAPSVLEIPTVSEVGLALLALLLASAGLVALRRS